MTNIFEAAKEKIMPTWMKFINAGDSVQGTYVGKIVGQIDGYGNEQIIYQLLQDDGTVMNVGFGVNKKFLNQDMESVKFGQIIGFKYKGTISVKDKFGKPVNVKDFALHQDPKIVNETWLKENEGNMPEVTRVSKSDASVSAKEDFGAFNNVPKEKEVDDVPFSSEGSLTNEDKLAVIEKLAKDKLGVTDPSLVKDKVMETLGVAFIPVNFSSIIEKLKTM